MSTVTRKGLEFIVNQIGKAKYVFKDLIGDTTYIRGNRLEFEKIIKDHWYRYRKLKRPLVNCFLPVDRGRIILVRLKRI